MPSDSTQDPEESEDFHTRIARLERALAASEALRPPWNEDWPGLLLRIARWQIAAERTENTALALNQPLSAIANYAVAATQLLSRSEAIPVEELQRVLGKLEVQVSRAGDLLRTIRMDTKQTQPQREVCDLSHVVSETLSSMSRILVRERIELHYQEFAAPLSVSIDQDHIQLVLKHLIQNAIESIEECKVENRFLKVKLDLMDPFTVEVGVSNSGAAIEAHHAPKLFLPFYTTKANHLGLGLSICREIIESYSGKIWVASKHDNGAEFRFSLPCAAVENPSQLNA